MRRERAPGAGERTLDVDLRRCASTATPERSCLLGVLCSMVPLLRRRMSMKIGGAESMGQRMVGVKEEKTGYKRKHQKSETVGQLEMAGQVSG